ncbi:NAD(+)--dinitrogen-reductase ADP-D-ribosyltransferase [Halochromatium salexigens]|uniref:NAD(+)--dinitrogen-reductase ADP-D-ribosyltransferase n=1 Tax=Halochromatium salexigens TaxID=49447 RepID=A0AAJ0UH24_HALSE|nr:NAD(+)--dinitrogen-reductase ADP-D-ribosyltransferase [Halochromatium salexigens]MBK5931338.1 NAD(+)--dinitrogen-reductase ADP-D-ribosyltransferase [Halochromatium salexigens]
MKLDAQPEAKPETNPSLLPRSPPSLPANARLPLNRCNLPAVILGGLTYQTHPVSLEIDGIRAFHQDLFRLLSPIDTARERAEHFVDYMAAHFCLDDLEAAGLAAQRVKKYRRNANYLRMVRGWSFDADGREGAVLKHWVETRFGLLARHHGGPLNGGDDDAYHRYLAQGAQGLYATNALEAQLDLLYTYCQYELVRQHPEETHLTLYRGINRIGEHEVLDDEPEEAGTLSGAGQGPGKRRGESALAGRRRVLLNNLNSFTSNRERACEFGDYILETQVPLPKVFFFNGLLPGMLKGEDEWVVIGGVYEVGMSCL